MLIFNSVFQRNMGQVILKDQWTHVLSEMYRVLKPGGVIELVEADLWHHNPGPVQKAFDEFSQTQCNELGLDFRFTETLSEQLDTIGFKELDKCTIDIPIGEWPQDPGKKIKIKKNRHTKIYTNSINVQN